MKEGTVSHHCISSAWNSGYLARRWGGMFMDERQQQVVESCPPEAGGDSFGAACPFSSHMSQLCVWIDQKLVNVISTSWQTQEIETIS